MVLCECNRDSYNPEVYDSCYECFLDRRSDYLDCIFCGRWHSPKFNTCFQCRQESPGRDDAGAQLRAGIVLRDMFTCQYCRTTEGFLQVDHVKPCAEGGTADPWNLQVLCSECNRAKGRTWYVGSRHDKARIYLMHTYFTFLWAFLDDEQREALRRQADDYGDEFARHARYRPRRYALCRDCDFEGGTEPPTPACIACGQMPQIATEVA